MRSLIGSVAIVVCSLSVACGDSGSSTSTGGSDTGGGGTGGVGGVGGAGAAGATGPVGGNGGAGGAGGAPAEWTCDPAYYDEVGQGVAEAFCDCACSIADPDCSNAELPLYGVDGVCAEGQTCSAAFDGCEGVPADWMCDDTEYDGGVGNGCDCACGVPDPDCALEPAEAVEGCMAGEQCSGTGNCVPAGWTCNPNYYSAADGCDCGCGIADPDCADALVATCDYCDGDGSCSMDACPGTINPTNNAVCQ